MFTGQHNIKNMRYWVWPCKILIKLTLRCFWDLKSLAVNSQAICTYFPTSFVFMWLLGIVCIKHGLQKGKHCYENNDLRLVHSFPMLSLHLHSKCTLPLFFCVSLKRQGYGNNLKAVSVVRGASIDHLLNC